MNNSDDWRLPDGEWTGAVIPGAKSQVTSR